MAVVRVKRRCDEEPLDALLLACKRRKTESEGLTSVFKFAATVNNQEDSVSKHISKVFSSADQKSSYKSSSISNITEKLRAENRLFSQNSRLKVVNCFRALSEYDSTEDGSEVSESNKSLTIVDIESLPTKTSNASQSCSKSEVTVEDGSQKYVYDLYYAPDCDFDENLLDSPISCHVLQDLVFEDHFVDALEEAEDSDDSNDENNWRNDYPDEDPDSIGEEDMKLACGMGGLNLSDANSLSSDGGEEDLVYGMDDPDCTVGVDQNTKDYFGSTYASYKKRVQKDLDSEASENSDFFYCDSDIESDTF